MTHRDQDVRLLVAHGLSLVLRTLAPECPFTDPQMKEVFGCFFWAFRRLATPSAACFARALDVLKTVGEVQCCVLMLDFDSQDATHDLFRILLGCLNVDSSELVTQPAIEVLATVLDASEVPSMALLDVVLGFLVEPQKSANPAAYRAARELVLHTKATVSPTIQRWLNSVIVDGRGGESELKDDYHRLIYEIYAVSPEILLPVLPNLAVELQIDHEGKRLAAAELVGLLLALPGGHGMATDYWGLFQDFLTRFRDKSAKVRVKVAEMAQRVLLTFVEGGQVADLAADRAGLALLMQLKEALYDTDEDVRCQVVRALSAALLAEPFSGVPTEVSDELFTRIRDKKLKVRAVAAEAFAAVFQTFIEKVHAGEVFGAAVEDTVTYIPAKLLDAYREDAELRHHCLDRILCQDIMPGGLPDEEAARHWVTIYQDSDESGRGALLSLLKKRHEMGRVMAWVVEAREDARKAGLGGGSQGTGKPGKLELQIQAGIRARARLFGASATQWEKAAEGLQQLLEMKDNNIFRELVTVADYNADMPAARKARASVLKRVSSRKPVQLVVQQMCDTLLQSTLQKGHICAICEQLSDWNDVNVHEESYRRIACDFLTRVAAVHPAIFESSSAFLQTMVSTDAGALAREKAAAAAEVLSYVDSPNLSGRSGKKVAVGLVAVAKGSAGVTASKFAVRALVKVLGREKAAETLRPVLEDFIHGGVDSRELDESTATLRALGQCGRSLPALFEDYASCLGDIMESVLDEGFRGACGVDLIQAVFKAVSHGCVPDAETSSRSAAITRPEASKLAERFDRALQKGWMDPLSDADSITCGSREDRVRTRLAASCSVVRLEEAHDVSLTTFVDMAMCMQDPDPGVREKFGKRVHEVVNRLYGAGTTKQKIEKGHRWLAVLCFSAADPTEYRRKMGFTAAKRQAASLAQRCDNWGLPVASTLRPEYAVLHIIHLMAHHPDMPDLTEYDAELGEWKARGDGFEDDEFQSWEAFQKMLVTMFEVLGREGRGVSPLVKQLMRTVERAGDATVPKNDTAGQVEAACRVHALAKLGVALFQELNRKRNAFPNTERMPEKLALPSRLFTRAPGDLPGSVAPPSSLMKLGDDYKPPEVLSPGKPAKSPGLKRKRAGKAAVKGVAKAVKTQKPVPKTMPEEDPERVQPGRNAKAQEKGALREISTEEEESNPLRDQPLGVRDTNQPEVLSPGMPKGTKGSGSAEARPARFTRSRATSGR
jgi:sister-chromatid-cohesion protein PDS5